MRETKRTLADDGQSFTETSVGDAPSSIEVSINAKGQGQCIVKLYFASPEALTRDACAFLNSAIGEARRALAMQGIPLAAALDTKEGAR